MTIKNLEEIKKLDLAAGIMAAIRRDFGYMADADSYKLSHSPQYRPGTTMMHSNIESRGGKYVFTIFAGLQLILLEYFGTPLTHNNVDNMKQFALDHGEPFDEKAWRKVVDVYGGKPPIVIRAVREGRKIPTGNVLVTVESAIEDEEVMSLVSYFETKLIRVWSPTTVATISYVCRQHIMEGLNKSCDNPSDAIWYALNDFGSRGTTCDMQSAFTGSGHLYSFRGTDNIPAVLACRYGLLCHMAGHSIAASEHSTTCSWTRVLEKDFMKHMIETFKDRGILACVSDTYNIKNACLNIFGDPEIVARIKELNLRVVVRPDSNDPVYMPVQCVRWLAEGYGYTVNKKGFKVLNNVRVIQGDGMIEDNIKKVIELLVNDGWSAENVVFGMGGGLLQKNDRDTQKFAMKGSAYLTNGEWVYVNKEPVVIDFVVNEENGDFEARILPDASFKKSKPGRLTLVSITDANGKEEFRTIQIDDLHKYLAAGWVEELEDVFNSGEMKRIQTLDEIREEMFKNEVVITA